MNEAKNMPIRRGRLPGALSAIPAAAPQTYVAKPAWLRKPWRGGRAELGLKKELRELKLHTVCEEARCPNIGDCFAKRVATVMIMGGICTRSCKFCAVASGRPLPLDPGEPARTAHFVAGLRLRHVVITSVDRDDVADLGSSHFAETIEKVRDVNPRVTIEVLTPDFQGRQACLDAICRAAPHVFNHNLETVRRLTPQVRSVAKYDCSLGVLRYVKAAHPQLLTKSGLMLGLGETEAEIEETLADLREAACDIITLGQYLQPSTAHIPVARYVHPDEFDRWRDLGLAMGFKRVFAGPYVRSSYLADEVVDGLLS